MQLEIKSTRLILSCLLGKICWLVVEQAIPQYSVEPLSRGKKNKKNPFVMGKSGESPIYSKPLHSSCGPP
jgi:hypothetical protein